MKFIKKLPILVAALTMLIGGTNAIAAPIKYKYDITGIGSGNIGAYTFTNQSFDISFVGSPGVNATQIDPLDIAQLNISGFGTTTFNILTRVGIASGFGVYFGNTGSSAYGGLDLLDFEFTSSKLTSLDQIFSIPGASFFVNNQFKDIPSSLGAMTLNASGDVIFSDSAVSATPQSAVPEPESYAMLLTGLGLMGFMRRRKSGKKSA